MTTVIDETFNQRCTVSEDKYGYEPAAPKEDSDPYGYGPAAPSVNNNSDDAAKYGYGDDNTASLYGYGDTSDSAPRSSTHSNGSDNVDYGYGDDEADVRRRRERPRRRGSVTKYSLEATQEVQQEFQNTLQPEAAQEEVGTVPLKDGDSRMATRGRRSDPNSSYMSEDDDVSVDEMSCEGQDQDTTDKKKKKKRFGRFRIGRNRSGMSTGSATSLSSNKAKN